MLQEWPARPGAERRFYGRPGLSRHCRARGRVSPLRIGVFALAAWSSPRRSWPETCSAPAALVSSSRRRHDGARRPQVSPASARASGPLLTGSGISREPAHNEPAEGSEGLPVPGRRAMGASEGRMPKRSGHAESRGPEGRGERPATGMGSPSRRGHDVPIADAIGLSEGARGETPQVENLRPLSGHEGQRTTATQSSGSGRPFVSGRNANATRPSRKITLM